MARTISLMLLLFISYCLGAQIFPKEGSELNFRLIGFSFPGERETGPYKLEIAKGHLNNADLFKKNIIKTIECKTNKVIAEVPAFGSDYTWRIVFDNKIKNRVGGLHHFSTGMSNRVDSTTRLRIITKAEKYKDAYVFLDATGALYDMNGNPIWYLKINNVNINYAVRDLKETPQGTITFMLFDNDIYEISYDGAVLWKGPNTGEVSGEGTEHYHHEFTRLKNGHYMVPGGQELMWELPGYHNSNNMGEHGIIRDSNNIYRQKMLFGTIIEYDEKGKVVWSWKSADYFKNADIIIQKEKNGRYEINDPHENSFFFDEQEQTIYVGYRNLSRIIKLKYPEGTVMAVYGTKYAPGIEQMGTDMFCGQHSIEHAKDGYLYVYNNNTLKPGGLPKIEILKEPSFGTDSLKKVWEYQCTLNDMTDWERHIYNMEFGNTNNKPQTGGNVNMESLFTNGGNVTELPDQSIFASLSSPLSEVFIVNKEKNILWSASFEMWDPRHRNWVGKAIYKASIIPNQQELEKLIWNAEMNEQ